jgi:hypothetical protein
MIFAMEIGAVAALPHAKSVATGGIGSTVTQMESAHGGAHGPGDV